MFDSIWLPFPITSLPSDTAMYPWASDHELSLGGGFAVGHERTHDVPQEVSACDRVHDLGLDSTLAGETPSHNTSPKRQSTKAPSGGNRGAYKPLTRWSCMASPLGGRGAGWELSSTNLGPSSHMTRKRDCHHPSRRARLWQRKPPWGRGTWQVRDVTPWVRLGWLTSRGCLTVMAARGRFTAGTSAPTSRSVS